MMEGRLNWSHCKSQGGECTSCGDSKPKVQASQRCQREVRALRRSKGGRSGENRYEHVEDLLW